MQWATILLIANVVSFIVCCSVRAEYDLLAADDQANQQEICDTLKSFSDKLDNLIEKFGSLEDKVRHSLPKRSCEEIKAAVPESRSGYYSVLIDGKQLRTVYCNMEELCGDKGWLRVGLLDMTQGGQNCPPGFRTYQQNGVRCCGRQSNMNQAGCASVYFPTNGFKYTQVCGRVTGYQKGSTDALAVHSVGERGNIDKAYVDGVSITRGSGPRKHIWTYISSLFEDIKWCPCDQNSVVKTPLFVGEDYFCETGTKSKWDLTTLHINDLLWDGRECGSVQEACCKKSQDMPWFKKAVGTPTTDTLELRVCGDQGVGDEDLGVNYYEIYVK